MEKCVLVLGATGRQGGAVARHLANRGWAVRALTRHPDSKRAKDLAATGMCVVQGDLKDVASLDRALEGCHGLFVVTDSWEHGTKGEIAQGRRVAEAAKRASVRHVVFGSVGDCRDAKAPPHFRSKGEIEAHIEQLDLPFTFLRPAFFMEMFDVKEKTAGRRTADVVWSFMRYALGATGKLQLIAVDDIGRVAADAFDDPEHHVGSVVDLAGDSLTFAQVEAIMRNRELKRPSVLPRVILKVASWASSELRENFEFIHQGGWQMDVTAQRRSRPWLSTFDQWAVARAA